MEQGQTYIADGEIFIRPPRSSIKYYEHVRLARFSELLQNNKFWCFVKIRYITANV